MLVNTDHQFKKSDFYIPDYDIDILFVGTFNPEHGEKVPYFYGRKTNYFWKILSLHYKRDISPYSDDFFDVLRELKIGCMDLVDSVTYNKELDKFINGSGYQDSVLFKKKNNVKISYNTESIISIVLKNNVQKVFFTNKGGVFLNEQKKQIKLIHKVCEICHLPSPSQLNVHRNGGLHVIAKEWSNILKSTS